MISYSKILPLLIIVSMLSFSIRLTEVVTGVSNLSDVAYAKAADDDKAHAKEEEHEEPMAKGHMQSDKKKKGVDVVEGDDAKAPKWRDASDSDLDVTSIKLEMFEDLSKRRAELEKMEEDVRMREALLKAAEQELDRKVQELTNLRKEIEELLELQSGQEQQRIDSLVKIYEGMKPKDAARIFDTLDLDVLVMVMSKMSERKVAPVLAAMNPERARTVTIMLAEERTLPTLQ
jgi:flagellar motility protein MotE (MotC chaperone)